MGCGCSEQIKKRSCYDNIKEIAGKFAKAENVMVIIYRQGEKYNFIQADTPEAESITPIEYISPLL